MALKWVIATLTADATLDALLTGGVWPKGHEPVGILGNSPFLPFALVEALGSGDEAMAMENEREWVYPIFTITLYDHNHSYANLDDAATRIDTLLTAAQYTAVTGGYIISAEQDNPPGPILTTEKVPAGTVFDKVILQYRFQVREI